MKEIILTNGNIAFVDDEDFEKVNQFKWYEDKCKNTSYARLSSNNKHKRGTRMHTFIINKPDLIIDHKNHNGLHNYRSNLRPCTHSQNQMNKINKPNCSSKYKGVRFHKENKNYQSRIRINRKTLQIGMFTNEIEAAKAYDKYAKELFGEFAYLNFPD